MKRLYGRFVLWLIQPALDEESRRRSVEADKSWKAQLDKLFPDREAAAARLWWNSIDGIADKSRELFIPPCRSDGPLDERSSLEAFARTPLLRLLRSWFDRTLSTLRLHRASEHRTGPEGVRSPGASESST